MVDYTNQFNAECIIHKFPKIMYCINDSKFICSNCIEDHSNHQFFSKKQLTDLISNKRIKENLEKQIQELNNIRENTLQFANFLSEKMNEIKNKISQLQNQDDFQKIKDLSDTSFKKFYQEIEEYEAKDQIEKDSHDILNSYYIFQENFKKFYENQQKILENFEKVLLDSTIIMDSSIIKNTTDINLLKEWLGNPNAKFRLLFRGSRDSFKSLVFHEKVKDKSQTLIVVLSKNHNRIFGGYNPIKWNNSLHKVSFPDTTGKAFVFSLTNKTKHSVYQNLQNALYYSTERMAVFGGGFDISIDNDCNIQNKYNYTKFGYTYDCRQIGDYESTEVYSYLAGCKNFFVEDIEAFFVE